MKIIKIILAVALFVFALALGSENQELVQFNYLIAQGEFQLSVLLGIVFAIGFFIAWLFFATWYFKAQLEISRQRRQLKKLGHVDPKAESAKSSKKKADSQTKSSPKVEDKKATDAPKAAEKPALASPAVDETPAKG